MDHMPLSSRDISWLSFNHRVLQEAMDHRVPLYERIKFLAIYSSNLDEFFRVRVASLRSFKDLKKKTRKALDIKPKKELKQIRKIVHLQQQTFGRIFREELIPALLAEGITLIPHESYTSAQQDFARNYFFEKVYPQINILEIELEAEAPPPFLKNKVLYFIVTFPDIPDLKLVEIPSSRLPRFVELPPTEAGKHSLTFLDDIVRHNLKELLIRPIENAYAVKLSRDAEIYIEDEFSGDLIAKIKKGLEKRNIGAPTRFLYDSSMKNKVLKQLMQRFELTKNDIIPGARYHNFNDFLDFPNPTRKDELHHPAFPPLNHPVLESGSSIRETIQQRDVILHFPYQRYSYVSQFIREAALDPQVQSLKITLYRVAQKSKVIEALLEALKRGKEVVVFIEAKARFDEAHNLFWGEELEKAGAKVIYSYPGIKIHTKLFLFIRKEEESIRYYAYLGTGNFNEKTARIYCDHALLTANQSLAREVEQIFALLERRILVPRCKHLLVAPFNLRTSLIERIDQEITHARAGRQAYLILKVNNLEDPKMIQKFYEASQAGVSIKIIVRTICCLQPGIEGCSENIEVISIVDRFLEHARVYIFGNGGREKMYLASADWMTRNLDRRIEVAIPIYAPRIFQEIRDMITLQLKDNQKARIVTAEMANAYKKRLDDEPPVRAQVDTYRYLEKKLSLV
jgi:polyphosphate kinase